MYGRQRQDTADAGRAIFANANQRESYAKNGVTILDPQQVYIEERVEIGRDTIFISGRDALAVQRSERIAC